MHPARPKPLSHVRVLDLSRLLPGRLRFAQAWNGTSGESSGTRKVGGNGHRIAGNRLCRGRYPAISAVCPRPLARDNRSER
jgi:hypothetical protein